MTALRAPEADHSEDPPEQVTPRAPARPPLRPPREVLSHRRRYLLRLSWRRSNARPKPRPRRQHPVVVHLVRPRRRHQRHQPPCRATLPGLRVPTAAMGIAAAQTSSSRLSSSAVVPSLQARFSASRTRPSGSASTRSFASGGRAMYRQSCSSPPDSGWARLRNRLRTGRDVGNHIALG